MAELRAALETLARAEGSRLRPAATKKELAAAEKELGIPFPAWLREVLLVCDGWTDGAHGPPRLLRLGTLGGKKPLSAEGGLLGVWGFYKDELESGAELEAGWIGVDCVPFFDLHDGQFLVFRRDSDLVFEFAHDEGVSTRARGQPFAKWLDAQVRGAKKSLAARDERERRLAAEKPFESLRRPTKAGGASATFAVKDILSSIPFLIDDPEQPGRWTARIDPVPPSELEGTFAIKGNARTFHGVVRNGLLRLKPDGGAPPRWSKKSVVELRGAVAAAPASDEAAHACVADHLERQVKDEKLDPAHLEVAALLGHPAAALALARKGKRPAEAPLDQLVSELAARGRAPAVRVALAFAYSIADLFAFDEALDEKLRDFLFGHAGSLAALRDAVAARTEPGPAVRALGLLAESLVAKKPGASLSEATRTLAGADPSVEPALRAALRGLGPWALGLKPRDWPDVPWGRAALDRSVKVVASAGKKRQS